MFECGAEKISSAVKLSKILRAEVNKISSLKTFEAVKDFSLDLTKVTVNVEGTGLTGIDAEKILRHKFKIQCELSDTSNLLFIISYADNESTVSKLIDALKLMRKAQCVRLNNFKNFSGNEISAALKSPREIFFTKSEVVPIEKSVGRICAEEVTFYPPGIPILNLGEKITAEVVDEIISTKNIGARTLADIDFIKVV